MDVKIAHTFWPLWSSGWTCLQTEAKLEKAWFIYHIVRQYQFDSQVWFMRELSLLLGNVSDWPQIMATAR